MAVDIKKLLEIVQKRINTLDSSTVTLQELIDIANFTDKASKGTLQFVDDSSDLPNLLNPSLPTAQSNQSLTFVKNSGRLFVKKNAWKPFTYRGLIPVAGVSPVGNSPYQDASNNGYIGGGSNSPSYYTRFDRFPYASATTNATSLGNLTPSGSVYGLANSSSTHAYHTGGINTPATPSYGTTQENKRYQFSGGVSFAPVSDLSASNGYWKGAGGISSPTYGYLAAFLVAPTAVPYGISPPQSKNAVVEKFPFSAPTGVTSSNVGNLTAGRYGAAGASSDTYGYVAGGSPEQGIEKWAFSSDANATTVGTLATPSIGAYVHDGCSGPTHGYVVGNGSSPYGQVQKYSFSSDGNSANTGTLSVIRYGMTTTTSTTHGYAAGGYSPPVPGVSDVIDRFPFSSDTNATDVGNLSLARESAHGWSN